MPENEMESPVADEEKMKEMAARMREAEYRGLTEEQIQEKERQKEMTKKKNIEELKDTLDILEHGSYIKDDRVVHLSFTPEQMEEIEVFLPDDIHELVDRAQENGAGAQPSELQADIPEDFFGCENADALSVARQIYDELKTDEDPHPQVLVLNLASGIEPGGQVRNGAGAQEEDLCRRTSLLLSLESDEAKKYYEYNKALKARMGSDALMISPYVEVIKDSSGELLEEPFPISIMSCSAPMVRFGLEGMSQQKYENMLCRRITGILAAAASRNYRHLVLGAFGCGIFGNDAAVVSDMFDRAIRNFTYDGKGSNELFDSIDFAVLCRPGKDYNFREFCRNFQGGKGSTD
ncbi:MAG: TIGR02452 family protein [Eggerthellaceae bacterium]|nr:TIGR02452 family protein [Eggerthellaceae bacterium]